LADNGFEVVLKKTGGYITNLKTKKTIRLQRKGGVYILRMWIRTDGSPPFRRQGK
jgi:hypothetical protein